MEEPNEDNTTLNWVFGLFQDFRRERQWAKLHLETTVTGILTVNLSVQCSPATATTGGGKDLPRRKTPSRLRRNAARREAWIKRRSRGDPSPSCVEPAETGVASDNMDTDNNKDQSIVTETGVEVGGAGGHHTGQDQLTTADL